MEPLPGYDAWKTTPPEAPVADLYCDECAEHFDTTEAEDGDVCPACEDGTLVEQEPYEPCTCRGTCYC